MDERNLMNEEIKSIYRAIFYSKGILIDAKHDWLGSVVLTIAREGEQHIYVLYPRDHPMAGTR